MILKKFKKMSVITFEGVGEMLTISKINILENWLCKFKMGSSSFGKGFNSPCFSFLISCPNKYYANFKNS